MKKNYRPQRLRIFLGCEGESEQSYAKLLDQVTKEAYPGFHIASHIINGGGNPLTFVSLAVQQIQREEKFFGTSFVCRALLLDADTSTKYSKQTARAIEIAQEAELILIWQEPCHEAFLLLHTKAREQRRPRSSRESMNRLNKLWNNNYQKGMPAIQLEKYITMHDIRSASKHNEGLAALLKTFRRKLKDDV